MLAWITLALVVVSGVGAVNLATPPGSELAAGVWGVLEAPAGPGPYPGVIVLHGSAGWRPEYAIFAKELSDSGFAVLALDYYREIGSSAIGSEEKLEKWPAYQGAVRRAVEYLGSVPGVSDGPIGLVGFSRGAFLAVSVGSSTARVGAIVDLYGGGGGGVDPIEEEVQGLPPLLILHGEADSIVPVRFAEALRDAVAESGGEAEMHLYPRVGHAFNLPSSPTYSEESAADSFRRTVMFLRERLSGDGSEG